MDKDSNRSLALPEDLRDLGDGEVGNHSEQDCFGLVGWQGAHQGERPVERLGLVGLFGGGRRCHGWAPVAFPRQVLVTALARTDVVDPATGGDGEQPAAEVFLRALEPMQTRGHLDPHRGRQILGLGHALAPEVAQEQVLVRPPELPEGIPVALAGACYHLLHSP